MSFNPSKCNSIPITRKHKPIITSYILKDTPLERLETAAYLGILIASDLSWNNQVAKVAAKANRILGFVKKNISTSSTKIKELAYKALVRPSLEYAASVWAPHQKILINTLEMVQRRAARYVSANFERRASVTAMLRSLKWETLEERHSKRRLTIGFQIIQGQIAIPSTQLVPSTISTRGNSKKFKQLPTRTNYYKYSFFPTVIALWNSLPDEIAMASDKEHFTQALSLHSLACHRH